MGERNLSKQWNNGGTLPAGGFSLTNKKREEAIHSTSLSVKYMHRPIESPLFKRLECVS